MKSPAVQPSIFRTGSRALRLTAVLGLTALACSRGTPPRAPHLISVQGGDAATIFIGEITQRYYFHALTPNSGANLILDTGKMPPGANILTVRLKGTFNDYGPAKKELRLAINIRNSQNDQKTAGFISVPTNGSNLFIDRQKDFELPAGNYFIKIAAPGPIACSLTVEVSYSYRP